MQRLSGCGRYLTSHVESTFMILKGNNTAQPKQTPQQPKFDIVILQQVIQLLSCGTKFVVKKVHKFLEVEDLLTQRLNGRHERARVFCFLGFVRGGVGVAGGARFLVFS